ncbi:MAG: U32 family peptidase [Candidatus Azobacteroides sp.]|nr:U32 family peptidase [Candidatus Azobacteroides sp.]
MKTARRIELLAPAKNLETGIEAINHGADAVYIGAPQFSARASAGNSLEDIGQLIEYAHTYWAKVYVALNTLIYDSEFPIAEKFIRELYTMRVDALIIQDLGILNLPIPPVPLHASTQCDNRSIEKVRFFEEAGFSRAVLARELSLSEIKALAEQTHLQLEVFVHGALCVSYSGQCYISQALAGRSANRGECAQFCRLPYTLQDASGKIIAQNKHLLSLKDLNLSKHLEDLLDAGVTSLKIEGRLKETGYVKNITAYYRQRLDEIFSKRPEYIRASSGRTIPFFVPDPAKSFNRGFTTYFLNGRNQAIASPETPKSFGEPIGNVKDLNRNYFTVSGQKTVHNGDGLCFINGQKEMQGFRVNRAEVGKIFPAEMPSLLPGTTLYRNYDHEFEKTLSKKSAERKIEIEFELAENAFGFSLTAADEDFCQATVALPFVKETAQKDQQANYWEQLSKLGNTSFELSRLTISLTENQFIPSSVLSDLKRRTIDCLLSARKINYLQAKRVAPTVFPVYPQSALTYLGNVANKNAEAFYFRCGVKQIAPAFENQMPEDVPLMFTKYCILYPMGYCKKDKKTSSDFKEPLYLLSGKNRLQLQFDCVNCEMRVIRV